MALAGQLNANNFPFIRDENTDVNIVPTIHRIRSIYFNSVQPNKYTTNKISTAKYSFLLFIPKFLFEQFRKYANLFFLLIALLQQIPNVSPTGQYTTAVPFLMILCVSAIKEIFEDIKRRRADDETNNHKVSALRDQEWTDVNWKNIVVGDIVKVTDQQFFPADMLLLASSEPQGMCYIETSNLDGETNLKIRQGIPYTAHLVSKDEILSLGGVLECEVPHAHLYEFVGTIKPFPNEAYAVGQEQLLLRGSMLKNTKWIFGIVVYTGHETKYMLNSTSIPLKRSSVEKVVNRQILMLFIILIILALISSLSNLNWITKNASTHWYLAVNDLNPNGFILNFLTFVILYNNLIPISLQVTLEIVRFIQALFIQWDIEMYDEKNNTPTVAKTSNLNEELGQVKYIFSDKTGTLTCNMMDFKKCSIGGIKYGYNPLNEEDNFSDPALVNNLKNGHETAETIKDFMILLAVCHTIVPQKVVDDIDALNYLASSPDEKALVLGAASQGFVFSARSPHDVTVKVFGIEENYEILHVLAFTSKRKRMSVIVRMPDGRIRLMVKGADDVIFTRLSPNQKICDLTVAHLEEFATTGLRTLCLAISDLDEETYNSWKKNYHRASTDIHHRTKKLEEVAELIETDLKLLGATAIEDKLQDGVPETISCLFRANIKVWVLTGDKQETAVNIGYACKLFTPGMKIIKINETCLDDTRETLRMHVNNLGDKILHDNHLVGVVIDGETLKYAMNFSCQSEFLSLILSCKSVICCRMSPLQKAELVNLVKLKVNSITLAIGDGANDVGMIQAAHVGVGISGVEGLQAAGASDFSIGQFRFLKRLLLIHGAWSYCRLTNLILYSFYKNICLYLIEFWFAILSAFSGQILFERWCIGLYNVIFTAATPLALGLFDQHCSATNLLKFPLLYKYTQSSESFNVKVFWMWIGNSIYHSIVFFWLPVAMLHHEIAFHDGKIGNYLFLGNMIYTYVVVSVCIKGGLETTSWTWLTHLAIWGSIASWFIFLAVYPHMWPHINLAPEMVGMDKYVYGCPLFWLGLFLIPAIVLFSDIIVKALQRTLFKTVSQEVQEMELLQKMPTSNTFMNLFRYNRNRNYTEDDLRDISAIHSEDNSQHTEPRGYAFSQEENGAIDQDDLVTMYDSHNKKPTGN